MIPPGERKSVRLGNSSTGAQAERITYEYTVDTSVNNMLILKYAAVLQNPGHTSSEQPRFTFRVLNAQGQDINAACYSADFIASASLGWHSYGGQLWKDWTTVGVDLDPLHGQTIYIQLTTYDCSQSGHYGYAYFTLSCDNKRIKATSCGANISNTFTAPDGFTYRWYKETAPSVTLGTERSLHVTQAGNYVCAMNFVGATSNSCEFYLTAVAGERYPYSRFTYSLSDTSDCNQALQFTNTSVMTTDLAHTQLTTEPCDSCMWFFGDGQSSTQQNPLHYYAPGEYDVMLITMLGGGACQDTTVQHVVVVNPCHVDLSREVSLCEGATYQFVDTVLSTPGVYVRDSANVTITLTLDYLSNSDTTVSHSVVENLLPVSFAGTTFSTDVADTVLHLVNTAGCDSLINYSLTVYRNHTIEVDSSLCENMLPIVWNGVTFNQTHTDTVTLHDQYGADSVVVMNFTKLVNTYDTVNRTIIENNLPDLYAGFSFGTDVADSTLTLVNAAGCDSLINYSLTVYRNHTIEVDSSLCENMLPIVWNGVTFNQTHTDTVTLHDQYGADSVVVMNFTKLVNTYDTVNRTIIENNLPDLYAGFSFGTDVADSTLLLVNAAGCDSLINYSLTVYRNHTIEVDSALCENMLPIVWNGVTFNQTHTDTVTLHDQYGADSVVVMNFTKLVNTYDTVNATIIENMLPASFLGVDFPTDIADTTFLLVNGEGCDSLVNYNLTVYRNHFVVVDSSLCENALPIVWNGVTFAQTHSDTVLLHDRFGADSTVAMNLTKLVNTYDTVAHVVLENNLPDMYAGFSFGTDVADSTLTLVNAAGCDSLIHYSLTVRWNTTTIVDSSLCENMLPIVWNGVTFNQTHTDTVTLHDQFGADSVVVMNFTKLVNTYDTINATIIENMLPASFLGVDFPTDIADTTFLLVNGAGCDSLVNYNLTVFRNDTTEVDSSLCQVFFPLVWNGVTFLGTATDTAVLHTIHGADSVVIMHVSQFANDFGTTHRYVVENDLPFVYGTYSFSADVDDSTLFIQTPGQCDSVITFSLTIYPNQSTLLDSTICASSLPLDWNGAHFSAAGTQSVVFQGSHAVDSVVTMTLHVNPIFYEERPVEICDDTSYAVGNQHFQASGDWTVNMSTIHQCDSTVLLHLTVHPTYHILLDEDICQEQSYQVGGQDFAQTGDYEVPLISAHGCDSLVSLHLDVHPIFTVQVDSVNCEDGFVIYNGEYFNQSGMYIQNLHTVNRCDSVVYLNLFIETPPHAEIRAEPSRADFDNRVIRLSAKGHGVYNKWIVDGEELSDEALFYYDYPDDTDSVIVQLVSLSANGCADTDWVVIPFVKAIVWAPNVFTPGEASNNQFCVYEDEMTEGHVWLYTRQGVYVTDFDAMTECWDGRFKGQIAPQNSYVWILRYHTKVDPQIELVKKGTVTLLH